MPTSRYSMAATGLALALAAPLAAEDGEPVIVVTGEGLEATPAAPAYATQTVDRDALLSAPSGRIEDALSSVSGFQQFRRSDSRSANASAQGATLRALGGNATSRALVLLDGVPMSDPFFGYVPFSALAPERLSRVRITRGGGSGPFGAGALAGTVELESAGIEALDGVGGQILANDRGETEASVSAGARLGGGFLVASGRWDRGKGFFTTPEPDRVPFTARAAFDGWSAQLRGVAPLTDEIELQLRGLAYRDARTLRFEGGDSSIEGQDASLRLIGRGEWQFDAIAYLQARNFTNTVISSTRFVPVLDQRNTPATGLGGKFELRPPVGDAHVLRLGVDYRLADGELFEDSISAFTGEIRARRNAGGTNTDLGFFLEDDWTIGALVLTAGVRLDRWAIRDGFFAERDGDGVPVTEVAYPDRAGWDASFRGGMRYRAGDAIALRAAAYSGLRLPTLNELYRPFVVFPVVTEANAALENERLEGFEVGLDLTPTPDIEVSLTAFDNRVKNAVANVTIATNLRQRRNIDSIHARGFEASASATFGRISLSASAAWTDAEAQGSGLAAAIDGNRPSQTPRFVGGATVSYRPANNWLISASARHVGAQFEDDLETDVLPAFTTFAAFVQVPVTQRVSLVLRGENLTDETIVTRNQGGSIDLGTPRTLWGGLRLGF